MRAWRSEAGVDKFESVKFASVTSLKRIFSVSVRPVPARASMVAGVTVTGSNFVALLPKLSVAATVSVSGLVELSSSVSVVRSASTWDSVPTMVNVLLLLEGVIVPPPPATPSVAVSTPAPSETTTVNVSPLVVVLPVSDTLTPEILVATFCATVAFAGAPLTALR